MNSTVIEHGNFLTKIKMMPQLAAGYGYETDAPGSSLQVSLPGPPPLRLQPNFADMLTTVYVGHICGRISDESVKELLDTCGLVTKWNRQPDPMTGKWAHFGFCEFKKLEGAWRAVELLNGRQLGSRKLVVKADSKVQDRITEYPMTQRINAENEQRLRATLDALLTNINSNWREAALARDAEIQIAPSHETHRSQPLNESQTEADYLPHWYRDSRRESERLRRIERRKRDRKSDFERAIKDWENQEKRIQRDIGKDVEDSASIREWKQKLIKQDCGDERVVSGFSSSDRAREIEADERDRLNELKEIEQQRLKDEAELSDLLTRLRKLSEVSHNSPLQRSIFPERVANVGDKSILETVRKIPMSLDGISKIELNWSRLITEATLMKLRAWLRRKLKRCGCSDEECQVLSSYIIKSIEVNKARDLHSIKTCVKELDRVSEELAIELSRKCLQLLFFTQLVS